MGFFMDVTERRRAEEALKESEATLRTLIEANPESLFLLDTRGVILAASRVAAQRLDKSLEEIIGADAFARSHPRSAGNGSRFSSRWWPAVPRRGLKTSGEIFAWISPITPIFSQDKVVQVAVGGLDLSTQENGGGGPAGKRSALPDHL